VYLFVHPDYVMHALKDRSDIYLKTPLLNDKWRMVVGEGLICSKGDFWRRQRKLVQPCFDPKRLLSYDHLVVTETEELIERWDRHAASGEPLEMAREMTHLALANLGSAMFSTDWRREAKVMAPAVESAIGHAYKQVEAIFSIPERIPTPNNRRFIRERATLQEIMDNMIVSRRRLAEQPPDLLGTLLSSEDPETGARMTDLQVRNELMTFMFGGHETVAAAMAWTWYLLSQHPEVAERVRAELAEVLEGRPATRDDLKSIPYTTRVMKESLRLYPPVSLLSRTPIEDDVVGGYRIPEGSMVLLSSYVSHRHPDLWENPEGFDPDRWLPERSAGRHKNAWFPFSGGPRGCIGGYFGQMEIQIVMSMLVPRYDFALVPGHRVVPRPGLTLGFEHGLKMTIRRREA
jgi:cytochrome P450